MNISQQDKQRMMNTSSGQRLRQSYLPRYLEENGHLPHYGWILDFGCGSEARDVQWLTDLGYQVYGWDLHDGPGIITGLDLDTYEVVYASNVLNIQPSVATLRHTLTQIKMVLKIDGWFYFNLPKSPCYLDRKQIEQEVLKLFPYTLRSAYSSGFLYFCR